MPSLRSQLPWLLSALLLVAAVRLYGLAGAALPDYDSVRNWQIVQEVARGQLLHLFHHGSPVFSLVYAPVAWLTADYRVFQHLNALVAVAALGLLVAFIARETQLPGWQTGLLALLAGTGLFLTFSGRDFTMSSWSLLCFAGLLRAYYRRLQLPSAAALYRATGWLVLGLGFNYKFLLTLPILAVLEWWRADGLLWRHGHWWRVAGLLVAPYLVLGGVGVLAGLPWYLWPAIYYKVAFPDAANAAGRAATIRPDGLYYLRYLWDFESGVVWLGLLGPLLAVRRLRRGQALPPELYLAVWGWCLLAGMSLLIKAPRGLLWAYGLWYALAFLQLRRLPAVGLATVVIGAVGLNLHRIQREIYAYAPSSYPAVATWLQKHGAGPVLSTVGLGLAPLRFPTDSVRAVFSPQQAAALRQRGYRYLLVDGYWRVTNVAAFDSLRYLPTVAAWREPLLTSPLLFLEHSEFTGLGYEQTLHLQRVARQDSVQLRVVRW
ncbi:hypothetical protein HNQ93_000174 [Hymenobacter luteus]|uniref:Glycosyltransferase RgtA/B/C/D-like domain-containing protein n=2 Tax=Hymenobacter TaxID=89966 RepID=A0A7W9SY23_9BACT|nr:MULTISPECIES: hypothetical protein [Hymenobacter]MBB4600346.1 hypothetical protein [Hymenobacter latericoloratus]MBB6057344.1 hypothetical protein [Hymenobacter luteus]